MLYLFFMYLLFLLRGNLIQTFFVKIWPLLGLRLGISCRPSFNAAQLKYVLYANDAHLCIHCPLVEERFSRWTLMIATITGLFTWMPPFSVWGQTGKGGGLRDWEPLTWPWRVPRGEGVGGGEVGGRAVPLFGHFVVASWTDNRRFVWFLVRRQPHFSSYYCTFFLEGSCLVAGRCSIQNVEVPYRCKVVYFSLSTLLTLYRPAMPFENRKI